MAESTAPGTRVLLIEDEPSLRLGLADGLQSERFVVLEAADGEAGLAQLFPEGSTSAATAPIDAVLLDLMLPGIDGLEVLRRLRARACDVPVLILSARGEDADRILGFEYGADDFMVKPTPLREVVLRIGAVLRRKQPIAQAMQQRFGAVEVDFQAYSLVHAGKRHGLNRKERDLLAFFLEHPGETVARETLLRQVWGQQRPSSSRTVDTHVFRLRQKIEVDPEQPRHLLTVHGVGYRFLAAPE